MITMSIDPEKIGSKTSDPLFFIKPLTADEKKKMQESLREVDKRMGISKQRAKVQNVPKSINKSKEMTREDEESNENKLEDGGEKKEVQTGRRWADIKVLSKHIKYAEPTIREWIRLNKGFPFHRVPGSRSIRFDLDEVDEWMQGKRGNQKAVDK